MKKQTETIKRIVNLLSIVGATALVVFALGCKTTKSTEDMLSAAGFHIVTPSTAQQQSLLNTLPPNKVTRVQRDGKTYFICPDEKHHVLYVGQEPQFQEYQRLRQQNQLAEEQVEAAQMNSEAWGGWGWGW